MSGRLTVEMDFLSRFCKRLDESWQIGPEAETGFPVRILISGSSLSVEQEIATLVHAALPPYGVHALRNASYSRAGAPRRSMTQIRVFPVVDAGRNCKVL